LKDSYINEYTFGAEQEITGDLRAHVAVVRKAQQDTFGRYDRLRTIASFTPVRVLDPGPDGIVKSADDRTITVFETRVPPDMTDYYLTNKAIGDTYDTVEVGLTKTHERSLATRQRLRLDETGFVVAVFRGSERRGLELEQHADDGLDVQGVGKLFVQVGNAGRLLLQRDEGRAVRPLFHRHRSVPEAC
jgi:hypothetical protein